MVGQEHTGYFATSLQLAHACRVTLVWTYEAQHFLFLPKGVLLTFSLSEDKTLVLENSGGIPHAQPPSPIFQFREYHSE